MNNKDKIQLNNKTILITGSPGFIGANLVMRLLKEMQGGVIVSLDNMNDYYDVALKDWRLNQIDAVAARSSVKHIFVKGANSIVDTVIKNKYNNRIRYV